MKRAGGIIERAAIAQRSFDRATVEVECVGLKDPAGFGEGSARNYLDHISRKNPAVEEIRSIAAADGKFLHHDMPASVLGERAVDDLLVAGCKNPAGAAELIISAAAIAVAENQIASDTQCVLSLLQRHRAVGGGDVQATQQS